MKKAKNDLYNTVKISYCTRFTRHKIIIEFCEFNFLLRNDFCGRQASKTVNQGEQPLLSNSLSSLSSPSQLKILMLLVENAHNASN